MTRSEAKDHINRCGLCGESSQVTSRLFIFSTGLFSPMKQCHRADWAPQHRGGIGRAGGEAEPCTRRTATSPFLELLGARRARLAFHHATRARVAAARASRRLCKAAGARVVVCTYGCGPNVSCEPRTPRCLPGQTSRRLGREPSPPTHNSPNRNMKNLEVILAVRRRWRSVRGGESERGNATITYKSS
jgi:hypothetical protein